MRHPSVQFCYTPHDRDLSCREDPSHMNTCAEPNATMCSSRLTDYMFHSVAYSLLGYARRASASTSQTGSERIVIFSPLSFLASRLKIIIQSGVKSVKSSPTKRVLTFTASRKPFHPRWRSQTIFQRSVADL